MENEMDIDEEDDDFEGGAASPSSSSEGYSEDHEHEPVANPKELAKPAQRRARSTRVADSGSQPQSNSKY